MIKNFNQFNESFKEKIDIFKKDIIDEMKRDLDPILKFSHEVNDILSEYDDLGYSDYNIGQFSICFETKRVYEEIGGTDTPCLNFDIDLERDEMIHCFFSLILIQMIKFCLMKMKFFGILV